MTRILTIIALLFATPACAPRSSTIPTSYISPLVYSNYDCEQLQMEYGRLTRRAFEASGQQDQTATDDAALFAVGMVLFWPALFAIQGPNNSKQSEVMRLRGEVEALEQAAIMKKCSGLVGQITIARNSRQKYEANGASSNPMISGGTQKEKRSIRRGFGVGG